MYLKRIISSVNSWADFKEVLHSKTKLEKGNAFEELTKYYLSYNPIYKSKLKTVWLQKELPASVLKKLNLPVNDQGIDLIAETNEGEFWAIQCKYLQDEDQRLSHRKISTFISLSTGIAENISYCLVCTTVDEYAELYKGKKNIGFCNSDEWNKLDKTFFDWLRNKLKGKEKSIVPYTPKPHQKRALAEAKKYFIADKNHKGKLVFPCGAGKSLTGYWITKALNSKSIIVAVPSLSLVKQTLEVYLRETVANNETVEWLCVCSDEGIGKNDDIAIHTQDIGIPCVTDKTIIVDWLLKNKNKKTIVFTTYQSGKTIAEASHRANFKFDLGILDEAHKTVGAKDKLFSYLLFDKNISIARRIFMTATERRYAGSSDTILSMDDVEMYGETFATMSFKEAIEIGILSDYKIITLFISDDEVKQVIQKNAFVKPLGKEWNKETEARTLASLIALRKAMDQYPIHHAVTFHSSIAKSKSFEESQAVFSKAYPKFSKVDSFHVSGAMPTTIRSKIVTEFSNSKKAIITNAKCLTEGVDVPNIDCVLFADPRKSTIDIVQAVGRALRKTKDKEYGYVILPVFIKSKTAEAIIESEEFNEVLSVLRALASNDERIIEYFKDISKGKKVNKKDCPIQFEIDERLAGLIDEKELINSIQLTTWNKLAKLSWMPFEQAREFVRGLKLNSQKDFRNYFNNNTRPADLPTAPNAIYKNKGWISWGDYFGTGRIADQLKQYCSYLEARQFVKKYNLTSNKKWKLLCNSGEVPNNIPYNPDQTYKSKGWNGWGDFLGSGNIANYNKQYLDFNNAKAFVRNLKFKSVSDWRAYCISEKKPFNIPSSPEKIYENKGWINFSDWLGVEIIATQNRVYKNFHDSRELVRNLKLKNIIEWRNFCKSGKKTVDIPKSPDHVYKDQGWNGYGDWLGTNNTATQNRSYWDYNVAREFVRKLNFKNYTEWKNYCKSDQKPIELPNSPEKVYKNKEWIGISDWLGTGKARPNTPIGSFKDVKEFVYKLRLKNMKEWRLYCKSGEKPVNIPYAPQDKYKEWRGWADFLGTENLHKKEFVSYSDAKNFIKNLKLKSNNDWRRYLKTEEKPDFIPSAPENIYRNKGWNGWGDFLGTENTATQKLVYLSYEEAEKYIQKLNLKSSQEWKKYCSSGKKPRNIPSNPNSTYRDKGWISFTDFLGNEGKPRSKRKVIPFPETKKFALQRNVKSKVDWKKLTQQSNFPKEMAKDLAKVYKAEWRGWNDFLNINPKDIFLTFNEAKKYVKQLKLNSASWKIYCNSGQKPDNIPRSADKIYKSEWKGWANFLGKE